MYTVRPNTRSYSTSPTPYTEVAPVFERIKGVASKAFIKKINAVYVFEIEEEGKWHLDLKNGEGSIGQGDPSSKPDVNIILKKETFLKIFNRELKPATAFMNGEVKLSGDLSKIMSLEAMMKSTRNDWDTRSEPETTCKIFYTLTSYNNSNSQQFIQCLQLQYMWFILYHYYLEKT